MRNQQDRSRAKGKRGQPPRETDEPVCFGPLDGWLGFNLRMAQASSFQSFARRSGDIGVQPGRFATLTLIGANPGITQTALSRANGRDKSTLTPLITDLVRRGLVRRTRDRTDRRTYRLTLTPSGRRLLRRLTECARQHERDLDRVVGRDRARLIKLLRKIAAELGRPENAMSKRAGRSVSPARTSRSLRAESGAISA